MVFDDILTPDPDDTITFYLVDGKVNAWDKNKPVFLKGDNLGSVIHTGMTKEDLFKLYNTGNLKGYSRKDDEETLVFDDIFTPDPDDTITFHLTGGQVKSWDKNTADFSTSQRLKAIEERARYASSAQSYTTDTASYAKEKEDTRRDRIYSGGYNWYYGGGLHYR